MAGAEFASILSAGRRDPADSNSCWLVSLLRSFGSKNLRAKIPAACLKGYRMELTSNHFHFDLELHTSRFGKEHNGD